MSQDKPRTSIAIWLRWIVAISAASATSSALTNPALPSPEAPRKITQADDCLCDQPRQAMDWTIPRLSLRAAPQHFHGAPGTDVLVGTRDMDLEIDPVKERSTPGAFLESATDEPVLDRKSVV